MLKPGLVSITYRQLSPARIIELCIACGLEGIEWGGDIHVPHGDLDAARDVGERTRQAGLEVASYGSYYRAGVEGDDNPHFEDVLETAVALEAPLIRVWAGRNSSAELREGQRHRITADLIDCAHLAHDQGVRLAVEHHRNTLTDTPESTALLIADTARAPLEFYWQPPNGESLPVCQTTLRQVLPRLAALHVFHWKCAADGTLVRLPLAEGQHRWPTYLEQVRAIPFDGWALIEFVHNNEPDQLTHDAAALRAWLA